MLAAWVGDESLTRTLVEAGANVTAASASGWDCGRAAAHRGNVEVSAFLQVRAQRS